MREGFFVVFEGPDGCGKSTQHALLAEHCRSSGYSVVLTREPGGTPLAEAIRNILLDPENGEISPLAEAFLYAAARAQHVSEKILPALKRGAIVLCDRFVDSSIAYQGYGRNLGDAVEKINSHAVQGAIPDLTFFLDFPPEKAMSRVFKDRNPDRIESSGEEFHRRVYEGYLKILKKDDRVRVRIDANAQVEEISENIRRIFDEHLSRKLRAGGEILRCEENYPGNATRGISAGGRIGASGDDGGGV